MEPNQPADFTSQELCPFCDGQKCSISDQLENPAETSIPEKPPPLSVQTSHAAVTSNSSHMCSMASLSMSSADPTTELESKCEILCMCTRVLSKEYEMLLSTFAALPASACPPHRQIFGVVLVL